MRAPLILIVAAELKPSEKIPEVEQIVSTGAAAEHIMIAVQALGYGAMGEQFVYNCAHAGRPADATTSSGSGGSRPAEYARYVEEVAAEVESCLTDWNEMYRSAYSKAMAGTYTADDLSNGVARVYKRMAREAYRTIQVGMEGLRGADRDAPASGASPPPSAAAPSESPSSAGTETPEGASRRPDGGAATNADIPDAGTS